MGTVRMSVDKVRAVAKLVKLSLSDEEVEKFRDVIPQTLNSIDVLKELDTEKVVPTSQVTGLFNVFAEGSNNKATLIQDAALFNAKESRAGLFVTKAVFDRP